MTGLASGILEAGRDEAATEYNKAMAERMRTQNAMQKRFMQEMSALGQGGTGASASPADQMQAIGMMQMHAGMVNKGAQTVERASLVRQHEAAQSLAATKQRGAQLKQRQQIYGTIGSVFSGVSDQTSFDRANAFLASQGFISPYMGMHYTPQLVDMIRRQAMTAAQQAGLDQRNDSLRERVRMDNAVLKDRKARTDIARQRLEFERGHTGHGKTGSLMPPAALLKSAGSYINQHFIVPSLDDQNTLQLELSEDALDLRKSNPTLRIDEALAQAFLNMQQEGRFKGYHEINTKGKEPPPPPPGFVLGPAPEGE